MEGVPASVYKGLKGYWRKKGYQRINGNNRTRKSRVVELASKRHRFWRIKRLKLKLRFSPKKFLTRLRDGYVNICNTTMVGGAGFGGGDGFSGFGERPIKEYDEKMIVEIYKSIVMAQGQMVPRDAAWINSGITCHR